MEPLEIGFVTRKQDLSRDKEDEVKKQEVPCKMTGQVAKEAKPAPLHSRVESFLASLTKSQAKDYFRSRNPIFRGSL